MEYSISFLTLSRNPCMRLVLFSPSASILCRPMEAISWVSCSNSWHSAAFRSAPDIVWLILSCSSCRHSKISTTFNNVIENNKLQIAGWKDNVYLLLGEGAWKRHCLLTFGGGRLEGHCLHLLERMALPLKDSIYLFLRGGHMERQSILTLKGGHLAGHCLLTFERRVLPLKDIVYLRSGEGTWKNSVYLL